MRPNCRGFVFCVQAFMAAVQQAGATGPDDGASMMSDTPSLTSYGTSVSGMPEAPWQSSFPEPVREEEAYEGGVYTPATVFQDGAPVGSRAAATFKPPVAARAAPAPAQPFQIPVTTYVPSVAGSAVAGSQYAPSYVPSYAPSYAPSAVDTEVRGRAGARSRPLATHVPGSPTIPTTANARMHACGARAHTHTPAHAHTTCLAPPAASRARRTTAARLTLWTSTCARLTPRSPPRRA
jgi:hypothetical protein